MGWFYSYVRVGMPLSHHSLLASQEATPRRVTPRVTATSQTKRWLMRMIYDDSASFCSLPDRQVIFFCEDALAALESVAFLRFLFFVCVLALWWFVRSTFARTGASMIDDICLRTYKYAPLL